MTTPFVPEADAAYDRADPVSAVAAKRNANDGVVLRELYSRLRDRYELQYEKACGRRWRPCQRRSG